MASVVAYGDGWRSFIYVKGKRETAIFRTKREAAAWADRREEELRAQGLCIKFGDVAERWLALKLPSLDSETNQRTVEQSIRDYVLPAIGRLGLAEITRADLIGVVRKVSDAGKVETAHRLGQRIRQIFDHAVDSGEIQTHPAADLARVLPTRKARRMPAVGPDELPGLLKAINGYSEPVTRNGLLLLAHTFVRTSELLGATWDEIQTPDTWVLAAKRMKKRLPHVVPLTPQTIALLADLRAMNTESRYFLGSPVNPMCPLSSNTLLFALYRMGYRGRMSGHGFRAVASSILNQSGMWNRDAIERQLSHKETDDIRAAYNRAEYLDERRRMLSWWSSHLESLAASTDS